MQPLSQRHFLSFFCEHKIEDLRNYKTTKGPRDLQPNKEKQNAEKKKQEPFCYYWKAHDLYHPKESTTYNKTPPYSLHCLKNMQRIQAFCVIPGLHNIEYYRIISYNQSFKPFPMSVQ